MLPGNPEELSRMVEALERIDLAPGTQTALQRHQADLLAAAIFHCTQAISKSNALNLAKLFAIDVDVFLA